MKIIQKNIIIDYIKNKKIIIHDLPLINYLPSDEKIIFYTFNGIGDK